MAGPAHGGTMLQALRDDRELADLGLARKMTASLPNRYPTLI
jgi:hypothetical protein